MTETKDLYVTKDTDRLLAENICQLIYEHMMGLGLETICRYQDSNYNVIGHNIAIGYPNVTVEIICRTKNHEAVFNCCVRNFDSNYSDKPIKDWPESWQLTLSVIHNNRLKSVIYETTTLNAIIQHCQQDFKHIET